MNEELIAEAELGEEARHFVNSELGKCLIGMARQEVRAAQEDLEKVDCFEAKKIQELQNKAWLGRRFEEWLAELITRGNNALETWRQQNES
jgi:hypothetical protein